MYFNVPHNGTIEIKNEKKKKTIMIHDDLVKKKYRKTPIEEKHLKE